jgi:hypothetical protein
VLQLRFFSSALLQPPAPMMARVTALPQAAAQRSMAPDSMA